MPSMATFSSIGYNTAYSASKTFVYPLSPRVGATLKDTNYFFKR